MARGGMPRGFGGQPNMNQLVKQAQKMQQEMTKVQAELEEKEFEAQAGGGAVKVVVLGKLEIKSIDIKPEAVDPDDIEMLQDLIIAATNEALRTAEATKAAQMGQLTGGMNMGF